MVQRIINHSFENNLPDTFNTVATQKELGKSSEKLSQSKFSTSTFIPVVMLSQQSDMGACNRTEHLSSRQNLPLLFLFVDLRLNESLFLNKNNYKAIF